MPNPRHLQPGDIVPDFSLLAVDGTSVTFSATLERCQSVVLALFRSYY